jgi:hypothetical protein
VYFINWGRIFSPEHSNFIMDIKKVRERAEDQQTKEKSEIKKMMLHLKVCFNLPTYLL